jgi:hypothetical protein
MFWLRKSEVGFLTILSTGAKSGHMKTSGLALRISVETQFWYSCAEYFTP